MTVAVYYRVSTDDQTLDMQEVAITEWLSKNPQNGPVKVYKDLGISGATLKRPAFQKLVKDAERGSLKTVIVYRLDRLTRDAITAIRTILRFDELGVVFVSVAQPMFSHGTPFRHAIIAIFAELAQMEREIIIERVKAGLAAARKRGVKLGAPVKVTDEQIVRVVDLRMQGLSYKRIAAETGLSVGSVHGAFLNAAKADKTDG